jgi:hypothetical protein
MSNENSSLEERRAQTQTKIERLQKTREALLQITIKSINKIQEKDRQISLLKRSLTMIGKAMPVGAAKARKTRTIEPGE